MRTHCPDPMEGIAPADLEAHLAQCPRCRAQWRAHRETLALLAGGEPPRLRPGFNKRLMNRLATESAPAALWPWARLLLRLYWLAAAAASAAILSRLDWEAWISSLTPTGRVWIALALLASPALALFDATWLRRLAGLKWIG